MSNKLSSYQKLKQENQRLLEDIYQIVMTDGFQSDSVRLRWKFKFELDEVIMSGEPTKTHGHE